MTSFKADLVSLSDFAWERLRGRLDGLTDEEFLWEPVPGCWSVRPDDNGGSRADGSTFRPEPEPFTTAAWRIAHLIDNLQAERTATWLGVTPTPDDGMPVVPATAAQATAALDKAYAAWRRRLLAVADEELLTPLGEIGGAYADDTRNAFVLHIIDELIHHGAEVAVVRDLYRASRLDDPVVLACLHGDRAAVEALVATDPALLDRTRADHPDLLRQTASRQRWDVVRLLADLGFDVELPPATAGTSALHYAAGVGDLPTVRLLVEHGADVSRKDPTWNQPPLGWAKFFGRDEVVDYLAPLTQNPIAPA
ncbi:MAG TPA: ankyrin repeat domain-containing protein [Actinopolymorphaceae bacterium]|nr:ankyrin repeat domain-containing protein [Actinopolymorphaceae bacterium]